MWTTYTRWFINFIMTVMGWKINKTTRTYNIGSGSFI